MSLIKIKPTSPGRRFVVNIKRSCKIYNKKPYKPLLSTKKQKSGRNNHGHITIRHRGGGNKKHYRIIDFKRYDKDNIPAKVLRIEYDPNRSAYIALLRYKDGEYRYIISPQGLNVENTIISGTEAPIKIGNNLPLSNIPVGTILHCVEIKVKKGSQIARSAGSYVRFISREGSYAILRLKSGEIRKILLACRATIGSVSNSEHNLISLGKAGASRHRGIRPTVRGVAMNPVDHPHGGGEGKTSGGRHPVSPWGLLTKGYKTRNNKRTEKFIIKHSKKSK